MVVVVLIGIMTAMIIPEMKGTFEDALLRSTSRKLVGALNLAYSQAVTVNQLHRLRIDQTKGRYVLEKMAQEGEGIGGFVPVRDLPGCEGELDRRISIEIRKPNEDATPPASDEAVRAEPRSASDEDLPVLNDSDVFVFYGDGTTEAREVILKDRDGFRLALRINPTTARVQIVELERE